MRQWTHVETLWTRAPSRLPDCVTGGIVDFLPTPLQVWITSSAQSSTGGTSRGNKQASWVFRHLLHVQLFLPSHSQVDGDRNHQTSVDGLWIRRNKKSLVKTTGQQLPQPN